MLCFQKPGAWVVFFAIVLFAHLMIKPQPLPLAEAIRAPEAAPVPAPEATPAPATEATPATVPAPETAI